MHKSVISPSENFLVIWRYIFSYVVWGVYLVTVVKKLYEITQLGVALWLGYVALFLVLQCPVWGFRNSLGLPNNQSHFAF